MSTLAKTKRRINSVIGTKKVTKAMELVANVKLKRYHTIMNENYEYFNDILDIMTRLISLSNRTNDATNKPKNSKRLFIVFNSNLGLCAHYNYDIFRFTEDKLKEGDEIIPIGLKGYNHFKNLPFKINTDYVSLNEKMDFSNVNCLADFIINEFYQKHYSAIYVVYMQYVNSLIFRPEIGRLLPGETSENFKAELLPPIVEPSADELLKELLPIYIASALYQAMLVSEVSEQASRNNAMKNATDNADELLDKLKIDYNKARQGAITQEIAEVVSGAGDLS